MMMFAPAVNAKFSATDRVLKSFQKAPHLSLPAVLTYPVLDYDGDFVEPNGGDWSNYPNDPVVNWEHGVPVGRGRIEIRESKDAGLLPVGQTTFFQKSQDLQGLSLRKYEVNPRTNVVKIIGKWDADECLFAAQQAQRLVGDELVCGVSVEYEPIVKHIIGKSLRLGRDAYRVDRWTGCGYAHTATPVNPKAGLVEMERAEKALSYLETHAELPQMFRKSLAQLAAPLTKRPTTGRGATIQKYQPSRVHKGDYMDPKIDAEVPAAAVEPAGSVAAKLAFAQGVRDLAEQYIAALGSSDNPQVKKDGAKFAAMGTALADKVTAYAETLAAKLSGDESAPEPDTEADASPAETDDDGAIVPKGLSGFRPARLKLSDLKPAGTRVAKAKPTDADELVLLRAENAKLLIQAERLLALIGE